MGIKQTIDRWNPVEAIKQKANNDMSLFALKSVIILWCLVIITATLFIDNKWILSGILAYEVLP